MSIINFEEYEEFKDHADFINKLNKLKEEPECKQKKNLFKWFRLQIRIYESAIKTRLNIRQTFIFRGQEGIDIPAYFGSDNLRDNLNRIKEAKQLLKEMNFTGKPTA